MKRALAWLARALVDRRIIVLVYLPVVLVLLLPWALYGSLTSRITTTVTATAGTVDWVYGGSKPYRMSLPDGAIQRVTFPDRKRTVTWTPAADVFLTLQPGTQIEISRTSPCGFDLSFSSSTKDATLEYTTDTDGKVDAVLPVKADPPVAFRFSRAKENCGHSNGSPPVALDLVEAARINIGNLAAQREPDISGAQASDTTSADAKTSEGPQSIILNQAISKGLVEIFNEAWSYNDVDTGRYKMSEFPLGFDDSLHLGARTGRPGAPAPISIWNGSVFLGEDGITTKVSALNTAVRVHRAYGDYTIYFNIWQAVYSQPLFQLLAGLMAFCALIYGFIKK